MPLIETQPNAVTTIYARSLFALAEAKGGREQAEQVLSELEQILELARGNEKFGELLTSRAVTTEARAACIDRVFRGRVSDLMLNFLQVLNEKGRLQALPGIVASLDNVVQEKFGRIEVDVYTAGAMDEAQKNSLREHLSRALSKDVVLHAYTEPEMIGGVKLKIGDQLIDGSLASRLRRMKDQVDRDGGANLRAKIRGMIQDS